MSGERRRTTWIVVSLATLLLFALHLHRSDGASELNPSSYAEDYSMPLLRPDADWGMPPDEDWLTEHPTEAESPGMRLPEYAGWYRFIGVNEDCYNLQVGPGIILCSGTDKDVKEEIRCYDLASGEVRWTSTMKDFICSTILLAGMDKAYVLCNDDLHAYDAATGKELWKAKNKVPFAWASDAVWTIDRLPTTYGEPPTVKAITLLNASNGAVRRVFDLARLDGITSMNGLEYRGTYDYSTSSANAGVFSREQSTGADEVAVKDGDKIRVLHPDGQEIDIPSLLPNWPAAMAFGEDSILIAEYEGLTARGVTEETPPMLPENPEERQLIVRLISLPGGKELWKYANGYRDYWGSGPSVFLTKSYTVIPLLPGVLILDSKSGAVAHEVHWDGSYWDRLLALGVSGDYLIAGIPPNEEEPPTLNLISLATGERALDYQMNSTVTSFATAPCMFIAASETYPGGDGYNGRNTHLFTVEVDGKGVPVKGEMELHNLPESQTQLAKDFYESSDPLGDIALMGRASTSGVNALAALAAQAEQATPRQLDALVALGEYLMQKQEDLGYSESPDAVLLTCMLEADHESLAERICLWLDDESIHLLHLPLLAELAQCEGGTAKAKLDMAYSAMLPAAHTPPRPPFPVPKRMLPKSEFSEEQESGYYRWSDFVTEDGTRHVAFTDDGLASARDIYLGIDVGSDGVFEEILPTGINDTSYLQMHPGGIRGVESKGPLKLKLDGDSIYISHNVPILETKDIDVGGTKEKYYSIKDAKYETSKLSLRKLRLDSDGDGLTDITEGELLLNAKSTDSDGDGLPDAADPTPNADAAKMGPLERGVQRALAYFRVCEEMDAANWQDEEKHPFSTYYLRLFGCSEVAYAPSPETYGISLATAEERDAYRKLLSGFNTYSSVSVSVCTTERWLQGAEGGDSGMEIGAWTGGGGGEIPADAEYIVSLDFSTVGYAVSLCEIGGEYYPASIMQTWIS